MLTDEQLAEIKARYTKHQKWFLQSDIETLATHGSVIPWRVLANPDPNIRNLKYWRYGDGYAANWEERVPVLKLPCAEEIANDVYALLAEVERLHALLAQRQWVSVDERLPEGDQQVLVNWLGNRPFIATYNATTNVWQLSGRITLGVTHWMPLPAPPEVNE